MNCPKCGADAHFTVKCGKYNAPICQTHCSENGGCEYFSGYETSLVHCFYRDRIIERWRAEAQELGIGANELDI